METVDLDTWEACEAKLKTLTANDTRPRTGYNSPMLFRGQADASWRLQTSLERYPVKLHKATDYYKIIHSAKPQIETYTNQSWNIPEVHECEELLKKENGCLFGLLEFPAYEYMVYLRHHGFPSPLLDWTASPYVAAFFAFSHSKPDASQVSIYAYREYAGGGKLSLVDSPHIMSRGPNIRTHRRHFLQQCDYTICAMMNGNDEWLYACHEDVFKKGSDGQDLLWKLNLPSSERAKVLQILDHYNLNAYSLFGSEESLMETVAQREILFRHR